MAATESIVATACATSAVAVCSTETELLVAIACGRQIALSSVERAAVIQLLMPSATEEVSCVAFCRATGLLAAGAGDIVVIFSPALDAPAGKTQARQWQRHSQLDHGEPVKCIAWPAPALGQPPAVWVAGQTLTLWNFAAAASWQRAWSRSQPQQVCLMAASVHGALLATTGAHDRVVKVWHPTAKSRTGGLGSMLSATASYDYCSLRHPTAIASLEWRPHERGVPHSLESGGTGADAAVLLTASVDGVPRLWRMARALEPEPPRMFLCATLSQDSKGAQQAQGGDAADGQLVQLVQWLQPTARPSFSPPLSTAGEQASVHDVLGHGSRLSPYMRPPASPLLTPGMGVPTLRPSLRDRHDYLLALLADGTLVVWLVMGLSVDPRCSPKLMVWATLPQALPRVERVLSGASFCNFYSALDVAQAGVGTDVRADAPMPPRAESDQLPSAISMVQHILDDESSLRLCSVNVERGAATGERVHQQLLGGHRTGAIDMLRPHPSCSLAASRDVDGELLLWDSAAFSATEAPRVQLSAPTVIADAKDAGAALLEAPSAILTSVASPSCRLRLPGRYDTLMWLPTRAVDTPAFLAFNRFGVHLFSRHGGEWSRTCFLPDREASTVSPPASHVSWVVAHAFDARRSARDEMPSAQTCGFALRAASSQLAIWMAVGDVVHWHGEISLLRGAPSTVVRCAAALPFNGSSRGRRGAVSELGDLLCGYSDGAVSSWTVSSTEGGSVHAHLHASMTLAVPPALGFDVFSLAVGAGPLFRAAAVLSHATSHELLVLQFETCAPNAEVEFRCPVDRGSGPPSRTPSAESVNQCCPCCAMLALPGGIHALAVGTESDVLLYAQQWVRLDEGDVALQWSLIQRLPLPGNCASIAWAHSGALLGGTGALMVTWPSLPQHAMKMLAPRILPQWHPTLLLQHLLADASRAERVLQHLATHTSLVSVKPLGLAELLRRDEEPIASSSSNGVAAASAAFDDDFFAPKLMPTATTSLIANVSEEPGTRTPKTAATQLLELLEHEHTRDVHLQELNAQEESALLCLLRARRVIDAAGAAVDACGARFLLYALGHPTGCAPAVPSAAVAWAMLSDNHATLLELGQSERGGNKDWPTLRALGVGFWLPQVRAPTN